MDVGQIDASPTKELFIDTLVRDVNLKDAVLDLVDNSIDGYIRTNYSEKKKIKIHITADKYEIWDNCGGIHVEDAKNIVFRFGLPKPEDKQMLGVYGIGLKRSIFKMGSNTIFESDDSINYFRVKIDLEKWKKEPHWTFDFDVVSESKNGGFTKISVTELNDKTSLEFSTDRFKNELIDRIRKTYFLFMKEKVDIYVNDILLQPFDIEIGFSEQIKPANKEFQVNGVRVKLTAGAHPDFHNPGWYIFCNDRLIILGDCTSLTGWGNRGVPGYHPKFNRFKGFAYLYSDDPAKLPWTTAKNDLDTSSPIYVAMIEEMQTMTQQYTSFMSKAYPTDKEEKIGKEILGELRTIPTQEITQEQLFSAPKLPKAPKYVTISYKKSKKEVEFAKKCLGDEYITNPELGRKTFEYFIEMECYDEE